ncbi:MAG: hypothetical protein ACRYGL_13630 [Janthinobacterium lividum]
MLASPGNPRVGAATPPRPADRAADPAAATLTRRVLARFGQRTAVAEHELVDLLGLSAADIDNTRALRALRTLVRTARRNHDGTPSATLSPELKRAIETALAQQAPRWIRHDPTLLRELLENAQHRPLAELDADLQDRLTRDASLASQRMLTVQHQLALFQQASTAAATLLSGLNEAHRTLIQRL